MSDRPLTVAWFSFFPVEWLPGVPDAIARLPHRHPASWQQALVEEFKGRTDLRLHVFDLRKELDRDVTFEWQGVTFHCLKLPRRWRATSLFWIDTLRLRRKLREIRPDVVHAWGTEYGAAIIASRLGYPTVVSMQGLLGYFAGLLKPDTYGRLTAWLERVSLRRARVATAESTFSVNWLKEHFPHLRVHHVEHAPGWAFYKIQRRPETQPVHFLSVGSISHRKGHDLTLRALDRLKDELNFRLTIIGFAAEPGRLEALKAQASKALLDRVEFLQDAPVERVEDLYARATMMLVPTRADTGPVAVKEAAVAGLPVIGSAMGGMPDYITPNKNGLIFPVGDLDAFTQAIRQACADPLFRQGKVAPETLAAVRDHLSPSRMAEDFLAVYRQIA
jgi:glycosyltransferase involved in cell wall biosynthesis